jgi:hypothetical protein
MLVRRINETASHSILEKRISEIDKNFGEPPCRGKSKCQFDSLYLIHYIVIPSIMNNIDLYIDLKSPGEGVNSIEGFFHLLIQDLKTNIPYEYRHKNLLFETCSCCNQRHPKLME